MSSDGKNSIPAGEIDWAKGGIVDIAKRVISKEKAGVFMADVIASEEEVLRFFSDTMRGIGEGGDGKGPLMRERIIAGKELKDYYVAERRIIMSGKPRSLILTMQPQQAAPQLSDGAINDEHRLLEAQLETVVESPAYQEDRAMAAAAAQQAGYADDEDDWLTKLNEENGE